MHRRGRDARGRGARPRLPHGALPPRPGVTARRADLTLALAALIWGVSFVVVKAVLVASSSVLAPVVAFVALRQRPRGWVVAALGLAALGMYLLTAPDTGGLN